MPCPVDSPLYRNRKEIVINKRSFFIPLFFKFTLNLITYSPVFVWQYINIGTKVWKIIMQRNKKINFY